MTGNNGGWHGGYWRIAGWAAAAIILLAPLIAMQFTNDVNWGVGDFVLAAFLVIGTGLIYELVVRKTNVGTYRFAVGIALAAAFMLIWITLAVGIIGSEDESANLMFLGVLAVALIGALIVRFQPQGMARALFATALVQALVGVIALVAGWGSTSSNWPLDILGLTGFFTTLWIVSAALFQNAARGRADRDSEIAPGQ